MPGGRDAKVTTANDPFREFAITVGFEKARAVLAIRGEVDRVNAPELAAILGAVTERHPSVVLDLAELGLINGWGLGVLAAAASRHRRAGGTLTLRSPSAMILRLLDITGVSEVVLVETRIQRSSLRREAAERAGRGDGRGRPSVPTSNAWGRGTAIPADADVVDAAFRLVVALARAIVGGADGVSMSLRRHGDLTTVAASDQTIADMDAGQYATGEGPCIDASVKGVFHAESLDAETRWAPATPRAQALGINAICPRPYWPAETGGALNIYSRTAMAFAPKDRGAGSGVRRRSLPRPHQRRCGCDRRAALQSS